jgi:hypothetical protein
MLHAVKVDDHSLFHWESVPEYTAPRESIVPNVNSVAMQCIVPGLANNRGHNGPRIVVCSKTSFEKGAAIV